MQRRCQGVITLMSPMHILICCSSGFGISRCVQASFCQVFPYPWSCMKLKSAVIIATFRLGIHYATLDHTELVLHPTYTSRLGFFLDVGLWLFGIMVHQLYQFQMDYARYSVSRYLCILLQ